MAEKKKFQAIKGTRDLLPPETELWNRVEQTAREVFGTFGFGEIRPPIFEPTELFARSIGADTDVVGKEMYTFLDPPRDLDPLPRELLEGKKERIGKLSDLLPREVISLRPEATASVCRAYIEHGMHALPQPVKLWYTGPMFRRERPQKGRYRQFYQIGAEVLEMVPSFAAKDAATAGGAKSAPKDAAVDAEVIEMVMAFFARLGLEGVKLEINSIGDRECRPKYVELLRAELLKVKDKLGPDSQRRIETNPLRVLDSKLESEQGIIAGLPKIADHLCANCAAQYAEVKRQLGMRGVAYAENWRLVRGLDYYMRTTFEITAQGLGSQNAVCGGGRYDGLVELLGGQPTKGIGFAIGEDRLILSLQEAGKGGTALGRDVFVAWMGEKAQATAIAAGQKLRAAGFRVELPPVEQKFGKALGQADKLGARYALILGDDEIATGQWTVKTLADGSQAKMSEAEFLELLRKSL
ncbi:MAG TPA: histidine--tRNA ligase [Candidatus Baltobacteraceae bacterium]|nr:histidine--tRNA ligase [Candidatus Baltobacteraceae bacterium]